MRNTVTRCVNRSRLEGSRDLQGHENKQPKETHKDGRETMDTAAAPIHASAHVEMPTMSLSKDALSFGWISGGCVRSSDSCNSQTDDCVRVGSQTTRALQNTHAP